MRNVGGRFGGWRTQGERGILYVALPLLLAGCDKQAADEFWKTMGMLMLGLMVIGLMMMLVEAAAALCAVLTVIAELVVVILNIARPRPVTVVAGLVLGSMNLLGAASSVAMQLMKPPPEPSTLTSAPPDPAEADAEKAVLAIAALGILSGAALVGSRVYGWMRLRKQVVNPFAEAGPDAP